MDEEKNKFDRARRLLSRVMHRLVHQSFLRWRMYCRFERTVKELAAVVDPVADVLEKLPENRTPSDVQRLMPLVSQIEAYQPLHPPVRELLASYLQLAVLSDRTEVPRSPADNSCLFSVVYGNMTVLMGDPSDSALAQIRDFAAEQLSSMPSPGITSRRPVDSRQVDSAGSVGFGSLSGVTPTDMSPEQPATPKTPVEGERHHRGRGQGPSSVRVQGSGDGGGTSGTAMPERVSSQLWRTVIDVINQLAKLQKAQAVRELAAQHAAALEDMAIIVAGRAAAAAGGKAALAALAAAGGSARAGAAAIGLGMLPSVVDECYVRLLPALAALRTQVVTMKKGQSFSGRELLCQEEAGQDVGVELELPGRAVGAVVPKDSLVAVLFVSREVYHRAMAMQSEISVRRAVDSCCRLPFLRHTPLKELYRLSRHMHEITYQPGEVILHQGRENGIILFLVRGEVQVVLDIPDTTDPVALAAAMAALSGAKLTPQQAQALAAHTAAPPPSAGGSRSTATSMAGGSMAVAPVSASTRDHASQLTVGLENSGGGGGGMGGSAAGVGGGGGGGGGSSPPSFGVTRRIVLGRRASGVVLGDDLLREKRLTVGVVASSRCVCLGVSPQRFTMCLDPLTLRLFHKLRVQHSATAVFTESMLTTEQHTAMSAMFREAVLSQSYGPAALRRDELEDLKPWKAASVRPDEISASPDQVFKTPQRPAHLFNTAASTTATSATIGSTPSSAVTSAVHHNHGAGNAAAGWASTKPQSSHAATATVASAVSTITGPLLETANGGPPRLYGGLTVSLVQGLVGRGAETGSMATFLQRIKASEADALALPFNFIGRDGQLGPRDLDLSQQMGGITAQPQKLYTDMHEAACMAVIKVELAPGQLDMRLDPLAQVLDDIVVEWNDLAHRWGLQLVRWRTHDYFLVTPLDTASSRGGKRSRVRIMADALLSMAAQFRRNVSQNEIPHLSMCAGMAIGGLFSSYDSGHFLVHCWGQAFSAAQHLCRLASEEAHWQGTLLVADSVAQALSRTHNAAFAAGGNVLVGALGAAPGCPRQLLTHLPTGRSLATAAFALDAEEDDEPVPLGTQPYFKRGGGGGTGSLRLLLSSNSSTGSVSGYGCSSHFVGNSKEGACLEDGNPYSNRNAYVNGSTAVPHVLSGNHRSLTIKTSAATASLPHLTKLTSVSSSAAQSEPTGPLSPMRGSISRSHNPPTGTQVATQQQQQPFHSGRRHLSASSSINPSTAAITATAVDSVRSRGQQGDSSPRGASLQSSSAGARIAIRRSSDGGSAIHSSVTLEGSSSHRQLSARKGIDPRVSFHHSAGSGGSGGNGSNGGGVSLLPRSPGSAEAPSLLHQQTSRQEAAGGAGGSGLPASCTSPYHGDSLYDEGSSVSKGRASSYDIPSRPCAPPVRPTVNAHRRERIAAGSAMSYRHQLMQEISTLRKHQQHQQHQQQQQQGVQLNPRGHHRVDGGRQPLPQVLRVPVPGYSSDVAGVGGGGGSSTLCGGGGRGESVAVGSQITGFRASPLTGSSSGRGGSKPFQEDVRSDTSPPSPMSPMSQLHLVRQGSFEHSQEQYRHQQQQQSQLDEGPLGSKPVCRAKSTSPQRQPGANPFIGEEVQDVVGAVLFADEQPMADSVEGLANAGELPETAPESSQRLLMNPPDPTVSPCHTSSLTPRPSSSLCPSPGLTPGFTGTHSTLRIRADSSDFHRAPSPGYITAAVAVVGNAGLSYDGSSSGGGGGGSGRISLLPLRSVNESVTISPVGFTDRNETCRTSPSPLHSAGMPVAAADATAASTAAVSAALQRADDDSTRTLPTHPCPSRPGSVPTATTAADCTTDGGELKRLGTPDNDVTIQVGVATAAATAAAVAAAAAPVTVLPSRPVGVPSRRAPLGTLRPASPYIPFSAIDPTSDAAVLARGGSPPPHSGPPGTAGTVSNIPKLVACNYGYLHIPVRSSRTHSRTSTGTQRDCDGSSAAAATSAPEVVVLRNITTAASSCSRSLSAGNGLLEPPATTWHLTATMSPASSAAAVAASPAGGSEAPFDAAGIWSSVRRNPESIPCTPRTPRSSMRSRAFRGVGTNNPVVPFNTVLTSRRCSPPASKVMTGAVIAAASGGVNGYGGSGSGSKSSMCRRRRRGPSWQDLGSQRAAEQYAASLPMGLMSVSFSTAGLSRVPPLQRLLYLESLALSYNHLVSLTSEQVMGLSHNLKVLTLVSTDLDELPPDLGTLMPGLVELNLCSNRLVSLPTTIGSMTRLRSLSVAHNQLISLPPSLFSVATLEHLLLSYNKLTVIDEALGNLRALQVLDLGFNRVAQLPSSTTALGDCLTRLVMPYNQLQSLPPGFLTSMSHLVVLHLDFNPQLAADPQLGGGRGTAKAAAAGSGGGAATEAATTTTTTIATTATTTATTAITATTATANERTQPPTRLNPSSSEGPQPVSRGDGGGGGAGGGGGDGSGGGSPGMEQSMRTELSFAPLPDPNASVGATSLATTATTGTVTGLPVEGFTSVSSSTVIASTSALSQLLAASAAASGSPLPPSTAPSPVPGATSSSTSGSMSAAAHHPQMLPSLRVLSLSSVQLVQVPPWLPAGLQVLDLSRNNLRRFPAWLCRRLAPSLAVLRLHTNRLESIPSEIRSMSQLQLLSLEENPVSSPERIATPQGAGWAAEWLYRKKYRSRPEIMASLATEHTGLTGVTSALASGPSTATVSATAVAAASSAENFMMNFGASLGGGTGGGGKAGSAAAAAAGAAVVGASSSGPLSNARSLKKGMTLAA